MLRSLLGAIVASAVFALLAPAAVAQMSPKFRFLQFCVGCHQYDGTGLPPDVPSLRDDLSYMIGSPEGRDFMLRVPGVIGAPGSADEVAELLNWIVKSFYQGNADFTPFTAADVLDLKRKGMNVVRLGVMWPVTPPQPPSNHFVGQKSPILLDIACALPPRRRCPTVSARCGSSHSPFF